MKNLKTKSLIGGGIFLAAFLFGILATNFLSGGTTYDKGWKSWDITADVLENGDMSVNEKLVFFSNDYPKNHVIESLICFDKSTKSRIDENDTSRLKENSFTVSVYDKNLVYFDKINTPTSNASSYTKNDNCIGFSWVDNCYDELGRPIKKDGKFDKVFIYMKNGLSNGLTIEFNYIIEDVITKYSDYSVLNWKFQGSYEGIDNKNINLTINFPSQGSVLDKEITNSEFSLEKMTILGFGTTNARIKSQSGTQIKAHAKRIYDEFNDELEMFVSIPNSKVDMFPNISTTDSNYSSNEGYDKLKSLIDSSLKEEESFYRPYQLMEIIICIVGGVLLILNIAVIAYCYIKYDKELKSNFDFEFLREIPNETYSPSVASYLVNEEKLDRNSLNAELMDLIRRKYITIDTNGQDLTSVNPDFIMILNKEKLTSSNDLTSSEAYLLNWFFNKIGKNGVLSLSRLDKYMENETNAQQYASDNQTWIKDVKIKAKNMHWFDRVNAKKFVFVGILSLIYSLICSGLVFENMLSWVAVLFIALNLGSLATVFIYVPTIKRKTQVGIDEYTKWMAFKKFLQEFSNFEDYPMPSLIVWEHYMVYATMFGIADLVEKQLKTKFVELGQLDEYYRYPCFRYRYHRYLTYRIIRSMNIGQQTIAKARARQVSSRGRSGGFGGGSSFGGGGRGGSIR